MKIFNVTLYGMTEKKEEPCHAGDCTVGEKSIGTFNFRFFNVF